MAFTDLVKPFSCAIQTTMNQNDRFNGEASSSDRVSAGFITPGWPPDAFANGIVPYIANIAEDMRRDGHRVAILAERYKKSANPDVDFDVYPANAVVPSKNLAVRAVDYLAYKVSAEMGLRRQTTRSLISICQQLIKERGLQIIEMEESRGQIRWLQKGLPIPVVVRLHGPWFLNGPFQGAVEDAAFRNRVEREREAILAADGVTAASLDVLERTRAYYNVPLAEAEVIHPPTTMIPPEEHWKPEGSEADTIVFVGRFDRHKGGDLVIDAFGEVARQRPTARLIFAGPERNYLDDAGRPWSIQDYMRDRLPEEIIGKIQWLGAQPSGSLAGLRRRGAVVVVGSRYDNFPVTVLEAMAVGCPLVAPRIGGIPEILVDGVNGLLFKVGDTGDMAAKLIQLLDDRDLAARLGSQAALDCKRLHDPSVLAKKTAEYFQKVIKNHSDRRLRVPSP